MRITIYTPKFADRITGNQIDNNNATTIRYNLKKDISNILKSFATFIELLIIRIDIIVKK